MSWNTIEGAIQDWVVSASGFQSSRVIWANQNGPQPSLDFITMQVGEVLDVDGPIPMHYLTNLTRPSGQEVEEHVSALREFGLTLVATTNDSTGANAARSILSRVQAALSLDSTRSAFETAGVSCFDRGNVQSLPVILGTAWAGRAVVEVRFYTREEVGAFYPYIDTVQTTSYMGPPASGTRDNIDI